MKNSQRKKEETLRTVHLDQKFTTADLSFFHQKETTGQCAACSQ
jgi:hypothetical protein